MGANFIDLIKCMIVLYEKMTIKMHEGEREGRKCFRSGNKKKVVIMSVMIRAYMVNAVDAFYDSKFKDKAVRVCSAESWENTIKQAVEEFGVHHDFVDSAHILA